MEHDAPRPARRPTLLAEVRGLLAVLALVFGFQSLVAKPFYIPSESMMPTLLVGDRLVVSKFPYGWSFSSVGFHLLPATKGRLLARFWKCPAEWHLRGLAAHLLFGAVTEGARRAVVTCFGMLRR